MSKRYTSNALLQYELIRGNVSRVAKNVVYYNDTKGVFWYENILGYLRILKVEASTIGYRVLNYILTVKNEYKFSTTRYFALSKEDAVVTLIGSVGSDVNMYFNRRLFKGEK